MSERDIRDAIEPLGLDLVDFDIDLAHLAGMHRPATRQLGLTLGNRVCLAVGERPGVPAITTDRCWLRLGIQIQAVR